MRRIERSVALIAEQVEEAVLEMAVLLSTASHRDSRREQWRADLEHADEVGVSRAALLSGALGTALLHRQPMRQKDAESPVFAPVLNARPLPHSLPTVPLLILSALLSMLSSSVALALLGSFIGTPARQFAYFSILILASIVPAALAAAGVLLGTKDRRVLLLGSLTMLALGIIWALILVGHIRLDYWLGAGLIASAATLVWTLSSGTRGSRLTAALIPFVIAGATNLTLSFGVVTGIWSTIGLPFLLTNLLPFVAAALTGATLVRISTPALHIQPVLQAIVNRDGHHS
ncbi:hypothetical protein [Frigoribacterium sp. CFBP 8751]|uniref:hypothetical protein n=1 Tax=Frigoribacterium sp. CFBP 8751 TaxID=2775277 RepID=UPI00177AF6E7|nr:hypothetical protein [Frigoribacterium sp. CFBP 8751]MBD8540565.1 hypothetical protein [Frigoribacterium sp. CFBP 8751]